jgi:hypothetical protein
MHLSGLDFDSHVDMKQEICSKCILRRDSWDRGSKYEIINIFKSDLSIDLTGIYSKEKLSDSSINPEKFIYNGIPFGIYAAYDLLIYNKSPNGKLSLNQFDAFLSKLQKVVGVYEYCLKLFSMKAIDCLYIYDSQYSLNKAAVRAATDLGIKTIEITRSIYDASDDISISMRTVTGGIEDMKPPIKDWNKKKSNALSRTDKESIEDYIKEKCNPKSLWTYSHGRTDLTMEIQEFMKINIKKAHRILIPLSSCDEQTAGFMNKGFLDEFGQVVDRMKVQEEWLEQLIKELVVSLSDNFCAIIRIHPRMFSDKRTGASSPYLSDLETKLNALPSSFYVDTPRQGNGILPLMGFSNSVITQSSSVGLDAVLFSRKLITFGSVFSGSWPSECEIRLKKLGMLRETLETPVKESQTMEKFISAIKWFNLSWVDSFIPLHNQNLQDTGGLDSSKTQTKFKYVHHMGGFLKRILGMDLRSKIWVMKEKGKKLNNERLISLNRVMLEGGASSSLEFNLKRNIGKDGLEHGSFPSHPELEILRRKLEAQVNSILNSALSG